MAENVLNFQSKEVSYTPTCTTTAVALNDVVADTEEVLIPHASAGTWNSGAITYVKVLDKSLQSADLRIIFLKTNVSLGTENSLVSISDTNAEQIITSVTIDTYSSFINSSLGEKFVQIPYTIPNNKIYVAIIAGGGATYPVSSLIVTFSVYTHL